MEKFKYSILLLCLILFSGSCRKELEKPSWDLAILAPLIKSTLNINHLITDSLLKSDTDSLLKIVYKNDFYKFTLDSLLSIPDTTLSYNYALPFGSYAFVPGQYIISPKTDYTTYPLNGVELTTAIIKSGHIKLEIRNEIKEAIIYNYAIPNAKLNNAPFQVTVVVPAATNNNPQLYVENFDLAGYTVDLRGPNGKINSITTTTSVKINPDAQSSIVVTSEDSLSIKNSFIDIIPTYAKGYFGQNTYNVGPGETTFTLFDKIIGGTLALEKVNMNLSLENGVGIDARIIVNQLSSKNTRTNGHIELTHAIIGTPLNINRATESMPASNSGTTVIPSKKNSVFNNNNSNIKSLIENLPSQLGYQLQIMTNPLGNISGSTDFIYFDHGLKASLDMEIPLSFITNQLTLRDTAYFNLDGLKDKNKIIDGTLTLFANNGFPFDADIQIFMLDANHHILDSLFTQSNRIYSASIDANYKVTTKKKTQLRIPISGEQLGRIYTTRKMLIIARFNTISNSQFIKIYSNYTLDFHLTGDFNYKMELQ